MDKNQSVVAMVAAVFVVVGIFLFFVLRSDRQETVQEGQDGQSEFTTNVGDDVLEQIAREQEKKTVDAIASETQQEVKKTVVAQQPVSVKSQDKPIVASAPQTGPGMLAAIIASVVGSFMAAFAFVSTKKKNYSA